MISDMQLGRGRWCDFTVKTETFRVYRLVLGMRGVQYASTEYITYSQRDRLSGVHGTFCLWMDPRTSMIMNVQNSEGRILDKNKVVRS